MRSFIDACLKAALAAGAEYADAHVVDIASQEISVRTGRVEGISDSASLGFGVRVLAKGAWGFASSFDMSEDGAKRVAEHAVAVAKASALGSGGHVVSLSPLEAYEDTWTGPWDTDPFEVGLDEKLELLLHADEGLRSCEAVKVSKAHLSFRKTTKWFGSTPGSFIQQSWIESGAGMVAYAVADGEVLPRSYPNSHGGGWRQGGWETVLAYDLPGHAPRVAEEAAALLTAEECPSTTTTVIIDTSQLGLQVHESIGHPVELDRVLGDEAAFAGTSWVSVEDLGTLRYGAPIVDVTSDATVPGSLGSFGYDDEGVPAQREHVLSEGMLVGFLSSRESAAAIGRPSSGCARADGWNRIPLVRMTSVNLEPRDDGPTFEELVADTKDGIYLETNNSWSIDDKRLNFQFATEIGWKIENGRLGAMVKNPNYTGITPRFWAACDAICDRSEWRVWGLANCGKGEPMQVAHVAHGASPARFRDIQVGVGR